MGKSIRKFIKKQGETMPENLPTPKFKRTRKKEVIYSLLISFPSNLTSSIFLLEIKSAR